VMVNLITCGALQLNPDDNLARLRRKGNGSHCQAKSGQSPIANNNYPIYRDPPSTVQYFKLVERPTSNYPEALSRRRRA